MGEKIHIEKVSFLFVLFFGEAKKRNGKVFILNLLGLAMEYKKYALIKSRFCRQERKICLRELSE